MHIQCGDRVSHIHMYIYIYTYIQGGAVIEIAKLGKLHKQCFTCATCAKPLAGLPWKSHSDGGIHCAECHAVLYAPVCATCNLKITGGGVCGESGSSAHSRLFTPPTLSPPFPLPPAPPPLTLSQIQYCHGYHRLYHPILNVYFICHQLYRLTLKNSIV